MQLLMGNKNYSSWSLRAWLVLQKSGLSFSEVLLDLSDFAAFKQQILAYSAMGTVPCLIDDELCIGDSLAIAEYIAEINPSVWPQDKKIRALARSVSAEMHAGFHHIRKTMPMNIRQQRQIELTTQCQIQIDRVQSIWQSCFDLKAKKNIQAGWLFGDFSVADAMFVPIVLRFNTYGIKVSPSCALYMKKVMQDEDVQRWCEAAKIEPSYMPQADVGVLR